MSQWQRTFTPLLNSPFKVLSNFPSSYLSTVGLVPVFSLRCFGLHSQTTQDDNEKTSGAKQPPRRKVPPLLWVSDNCLSRPAKGLRLLATASHDQAGCGLFVQQPIYDTAPVQSDIVGIANGPGVSTVTFWGKRKKLAAANKGLRMNDNLDCAKRRNVTARCESVTFLTACGLFR